MQKLALYVWAFYNKINARRKSYDLGESQFLTLNCVPYVNILAKTLYLLFVMAKEEICSKIDTRDITCTFNFFGKPKFLANLFIGRNTGV